MFIGPVFTREVALAPRRPRIYAARAAYGLVLLVLMSTAWLILTGTQLIRDIGDLARFGMALFQILAPLQLAVAIFFSALLAASAVSQEKDRHTLDLLLLTKLTNSELVMGKLLAALLNMGVLLATAFPVFMVAALFGGVSFGQIGRIFAVTAASVLVCGSLGSILALWREKTFQALALTMLILILWLAGWRVASLGMLGSHWLGLPAETWAIAFSPLEAIFEASRPYIEADPTLGFLGTPVNLFLAVALGMAALLNGVAIAMVRVWNPSRETQTFRREDETWHRTSIWSSAEDAELPPSATPNVARGVPVCNPTRECPSGNSNQERPARPNSRGMGQPCHLARDRHLGLWAKNPRDSDHLPAALRPGGCGSSLDGRRRTADDPGGGRDGSGAPLPLEPRVGQRPGGDFDDQRTGRQSLGSSPGERPDAEGNCLRQTRRRFL